MASGDTLAVLFPQDAEFPATNYPTFDTRAMAEGSILVLDFDDTTDEACYFSALMPRNYGGGGITVTLGWMASDTTITAGHQCRWDVGFMSVTDDADDLDSKAYAAAQSVSSDEASASGEVKYATIAFTNGAQMDSIAAGEFFRMRVNRDADHADDDLTGDAEFVFVEIKET